MAGISKRRAPAELEGAEAKRSRGSAVQDQEPCTLPLSEMEAFARDSTEQGGEKDDDDDDDPHDILGILLNAGDTAGLMAILEDLEERDENDIVDRATGERVKERKRLVEDMLMEIQDREILADEDSQRDVI